MELLISYIITELSRGQSLLGEEYSWSCERFSRIYLCRKGRSRLADLSHPYVTIIGENCVEDVPINLYSVGSETFFSCVNHNSSFKTSSLRPPYISRDVTGRKLPKKPSQYFSGRVRAIRRDSGSAPSGQWRLWSKWLRKRRIIRRMNKRINLSRDRR